MVVIKHYTEAKETSEEKPEPVQEPAELSEEGRSFIYWKKDMVGKLIH